MRLRVAFFCWKTFANIWVSTLLNVYSSISFINLFYLSYPSAYLCTTCSTTDSLHYARFDVLVHALMVVVMMMMVMIISPSWRMEGRNPVKIQHEVLPISDGGRMCRIARYTHWEEIHVQSKYRNICIDKTKIKDCSHNGSLMINLLNCETN